MSRPPKNAEINIENQRTDADRKTDTLHIEGSVEFPLSRSFNPIFHIKCNFADILGNGSRIHFWYTENGKLKDDTFAVPTVWNGKTRSAMTLTFDVYDDTI